MRVWIDVANSPHPLLFAPLARVFEASGHELLITARDNAQTVELARERWPDTEVIGGPSPRGRVAKTRTIGRRVANLRRWASARKADVALSHNSYAQILAARSLGIPAVTAMDYEHQPANHLAFRLAHTVLVPEVFPVGTARRQGAGPGKLIRYPGLKEELYVGDFQPDPAITEKLGLPPRRILAVLRTPPSRALYHGFGNPLFEDVLHAVSRQDGAVCVVLVRHPEQRAAIAQLGLPNCVIPGQAIDSRSLIYAADVMIGAGGTMTREAALMGIPTWTVFAGEPPAADLWLERRGLLTRLGHPDQVLGLAPRPADPRPPAELRRRAGALERVLFDAVLAAGG